MTRSNVVLLGGGAAVVALRTRVLGRWISVLFAIAFLHSLHLLFYAGYGLGLGRFPWLAFLPPWLRGPFRVLLGAVLWRRPRHGDDAAGGARGWGRTGIMWRVPYESP